MFALHHGSNLVRCWFVQAALAFGVSLCVILFLALDEGFGSKAAAIFFGAVVAQLNTGMLVWRWWRGRHDYRSDPGYHLKVFYRSTLERFAMAGILLGAGIAVVRLNALWLLAGFLIGQLAWATALAIWRERA